MDRLTAMELFVAVIDEGSMSRGARRLGKPANAATRAMDMLEAEAGEALVIRSTRRLGLTPAGRHWLGIWRDVLARLASGRSSAGPSDTLVLTAPEIFGRYWVQPVLEEFLARHPAIDAQLLLLDRVVDLLEEGVDMAIRVGLLPNNGNAATKLGVVRPLVCAAPEYLRRFPPPTVPADLKHHRCIGSGVASGAELWRFAPLDGGRLAAVPIEPRFTINAATSVIDAALRGIGVARLLSCQVVEHLQAGSLIPLLVAFNPGPIPVHLVFRGRPPHDGVARTFVDLAVPTLRRRLADAETIVAKICAAGRDPDDPRKQISQSGP